jgi:hypothetical protein
MSTIPFTVYDFFAYLASGGLIAVALDVTYGERWLLSEDLPNALGVFLLLCAYVLGHVVAQVSSALLECIFVQRCLGRPSVNLMGTPTSRLRHIFRLYYRPLSSKTRDRIIERARAREFSGSGEALFLHTFGVVKQDAAAMARLEEFRNLYGFARNIALSLFATAIVLWLGPIDGRAAVPAAWAWLCVALSVVMIFRYLKFFRQFSYELFASYAELPVSK